MLPGLECNVANPDHHNLRLQISSNSLASPHQVAGFTGTHHHAWPNFFFFPLKTGFHHVGQASLELPTSGDLPTSQRGRITGISHCTWPECSVLSREYRGKKALLVFFPISLKSNTSGKHQFKVNEQYLIVINGKCYFSEFLNMNDCVRCYIKLFIRGDPCPLAI